MHYDPFQVQVTTEEQVTTTQQIITSVLVIYYFSGVFSIAAALFANLSQK